MTKVKFNVGSDEKLGVITGVLREGVYEVYVKSEYMYYAVDAKNVQVIPEFKFGNIFK